MLPKETLDAILALTKPEIQFGRPDTAGGESVPFVVIPKEQKVESLEHLFPPARIKRTVNLLEAGSFVEYVNRFKTANTLIFANVSETGAAFTAMLDYHAPAPELKPAYCSHIAKFEAVETPEWKTWKAANRKPMNQVEFATFLEDNISLFVKPEGEKYKDYPTGAELLELVRSLHGHRNARFNTALRLDNGSYSVSYDEDVVVKGSSTARSGEMELPPMIMGGIAVFQGADPYMVSARLKSRCEDRRLVLFFETVSMHAIVRESIMLLVKQISEGTKIVPMLGNA